jgi:HSP20 family protein
MAIRDLLPWHGNRNLSHATREMRQLHHRIDRLFDEFFNPSFSRDSYFLEPLFDESYTPVFDIDETDTHYLVNIDLPGVKKEDVKIEVRDNQLCISGERKEERKGRGGYERSYGSFCRSFTLPSNVNGDGIEANYENGVLQISVPKAKVASGKQIPIKEGKLLSNPKK